MTYTIAFIGANRIRQMISPPAGAIEADWQFAATVEEALPLLAQHNPELILCQLDAMRANLHEALQQTVRATSGQVVVLAEHPSVREVVQCMKQGVHAVLAVPEKLPQLEEICEQAHATRLARRREHNQCDRLHQQFGTHAIIGDCPQIAAAIRVVHKLAKRQWVTTLILGETGTGKEVFARAIHYASIADSPGSYVEVNCAAIPDNLLEAELFGYEKGAFTDAKHRKHGLFELAAEGTLFLDEIGEMSPALQSKLLKAIESKCFCRLGGTTDVHVRTRIIAGTSANLWEAVEAGRFRRDLYFRLNVISIELQPLRERGRDVMLLAENFIEKFCREYEVPTTTLSPEAADVLLTYEWPGNVRELHHVVERTILLGEGEMISAEDIYSAIGISPRERLAIQQRLADRSLIRIPQDGMSLKEGEQRLIEEVLKITKWNKSRAAKILGISRPRLKRKTDEYELE